MAGLTKLVPLLGAGGGAGQVVTALLVPLGEVNHVRGTAVTVLAKPEGVTTLVLVCERGDFRVRPGAHATMPTNVNVGASVLDGTGTWRLNSNESRADRGLIIEAPDAITVRGYGANHVLTFSWR